MDVDMRWWMFVAAVSLLSARSEVARAQNVDFAHDVVPVLKKHCVKCHGGEKSEGGFSLNTRALVLDSEAVIVGKAASSRMMELVRSTDKEDQMPPSDLPRLNGEEVAILAKWVNNGLKWEAGFTFGTTSYEPPLKPRRPKLPPATAGRMHPIDRVIDSYLTKQDLSLPRPTDDNTFLRRSHFDVVGLPPSVDQIESFVADARPTKREALIDDLLARDRDYAEHWITFWNDLLRNAYAGTGYIDGGRQQITGWLYQSLVQNKPYDDFTRELIAPTKKLAVSGGFIRGIKWRGNVNASQVRELQFSQSVSQVFLGINMKCASCHDSFIDRWTLDEAYGLAAIYSQRPLQIHRCDKPVGRVAKAAWIFPELGSVDANAKQPERLKQLAALITHRDNGRFTRTIVNRIWHRFMGRGIVHPVDAMGTEPWSEDLLDLLAMQLVDDGYDLRKMIRFIMMSEAYQSRSAQRSEESGSFTFRGPLARRMTAEQFVDSIRSISGKWPKPTGADFKPGGRGQGGQLAAFLAVHKEPQKKWSRPLRASLARLDALQSSLGRPNREQIVSERPSELTTLEAINLSNADALDELLKAGAEALLKRYEPNQLVQGLYLEALSREPTSEEAQIATSMLGEKPTVDSTMDLLWAVMALPEFQLVR